MKKLLPILLFGLLACDKDKPNVELIQDMMDQPSYKAQDYDSSNPEGISMRVPPEGTVPRGFKPYPYKAGDAEVAGKALKNPNPLSPNPEVIARGKERFEIYCSVCHGPQGKGDGPVAAKMPLRPPSLLSKKIRDDYTDGRIFHVITMGQGVMGSYAGQVGTPEDRWAIVSYVRSLQKLNKESN